MIFGEAQNVKLHNFEFAKLCDRFGEEVARDWIEKLSLWKASKRKGNGIKSDYYAILSWERKDRTVKTASEPYTSPLGLNHAHLCSACQKQHEWHCGGKDQDGYACGAGRGLACPAYFVDLDLKRRQKGLF